MRVSVYGPDADPDGDNIPNAGEAYLGLDPLTANPSPLSVAKVGTNLRVRWMRSLTERGVVISLQTSSDLFNWATPIGIPIADRPDLRAGWETMAGSANTDNCLPHPLSESDRR